MRTIDFSQILFDALQFSGNDRNNINADTLAQFRDFAQFRLREAWESNQWTEVVRIEYFTTQNDAPQAGQTIDTTGITYFIPNDNASEILGVWNRNPQDSTRAVQIPYSIYENGTTKKIVLGSIIKEGWYMYRLKCPQLTGDAYDPSVTYFKGSQIYFDSGSGTGALMPVLGKPHSGNFYICNVETTTAGQNPNNTPSAWTKIEIPYIFGMYMAWGAAANWFVSETLVAEAATIEAKAAMVLEQEYDKLLRQQGQFGRMNMARTY